MTIISYCEIYFIINVFIFELALQMLQIFTFSHDSYSLFVNNIISFFSKLIIFIMYSLKDSQKIFMVSSILYTSCLFSIPSRVYIVDTEYLQGICSPIFVVDNISELFSYSSIFFLNQSFNISVNNR